MSFQNLNKAVSTTTGIVIVSVAALLVAGIIAWQQGWTEKLTTGKNNPSPAPSATETPDETTDWKIYKNEKYGFEIKYPTDWYLEEALTSPMKAIINIRSWQRHEGEYSNPFKDINITVYFAKIMWPDFDDFIYQSKGKLTIGGREWEEIWENSSEGAGYKNFSYSEGERLYVISIYRENDSIKVFDKMISTFKFNEL